MSNLNLQLVGMAKLTLLPPLFMRLVSGTLWAWLLYAARVRRVYECVVHVADRPVWLTSRRLCLDN